MKINSQLLLSQGLLVILAVLIVVLNITTFFGIERDANFINYAGKMRFLSYKMEHMAFEIIENKGNNQDQIKDFKETMDFYEDILNSLINGCPLYKLKKLEHPEVLTIMERYLDKWENDTKIKYLEFLRTEDPSIIFETRNSLVDRVDGIDEMVGIYSEYSEGKVSKAIIRNAYTTLIIIIVASYSFISVDRKIKRPMNRLLKELKEMELIDEVLADKINLSQKDELATMSSYIDELMYDGLTRVYNRRTGLSRLANIIKKDSEGNKFSLVFMDINGLKEINDALGHDFGDDIIRSSIDVVKDTIRDKDFIVRLGGDEFLIVLNGVKESTAENIWDRIIKRYEIINNSMEKPYIISVSHGVVEYNRDKKLSLENLVKIADEKMYEEKRLLKNESDFSTLRKI